jgi:hypothetical protein
MGMLCPCCFLAPFFTPPNHLTDFDYICMGGSVVNFVSVSDGPIYMPLNSNFIVSEKLLLMQEELGHNMKYKSD